MNTTLGTHMKARRKELGASQSAAAKEAGVSRTSWIAWEKDAARPEDYNHAAIERVLRWAPDSVAAIFDGHQPTPIDTPDTDQAERDRQDQIKELRRLRDEADAALARLERREQPGRHAS